MSYMIDWTTLKPYWKVVATSTSSGVTLPGGYKKYRVTVCGNKTSTNNWGTFYDETTSKSIAHWVLFYGRSNNQWVDGEENTTNGAIAWGARTSVSSGFEIAELIFENLGNGNCNMLWRTGMSGSSSALSGRTTWGANLNNDLTLSSELQSGTTYWTVEALVS